MHPLVRLVLVLVAILLVLLIVGLLAVAFQPVPVQTL